MPEIRIKHGSTVKTVDIPSAADLYKRIGEALDLPPARMQIIRAGKKLPPAGDPALAEALVPGALYLVSGTRQQDALPSTPRRHLNDAADVATDLYSRLSWDFFTALLLWLWMALISLGRGSVLFFKSMIVAPDPEPRARRPAAPPGGVLD